METGGGGAKRVCILGLLRFPSVKKAHTTVKSASDFSFSLWTPSAWTKPNPRNMPILGNCSQGKKKKNKQLAISVHMRRALASLKFEFISSS